jgi:hypothetical protein
MISAYDSYFDLALDLAGRNNVRRRLRTISLLMPFKAFVLYNIALVAADAGRRTHKI